MSGNKRLKRLVIDTRRWKRGDPEDSRLVTATGQMCCLGFLGRACGIAPEEMVGQGTPADLDRTHRWPEGMIEPSSWGNMTTQWTDRAMRLNDGMDPSTFGLSPGASRSELARRRRRLLAEHFEKIGYELIFDHETPEDDPDPELVQARVDARSDHAAGMQPYYYHSGMPSTLRCRSIMEWPNPVVRPHELRRALAYIDEFSRLKGTP